MAIDIRVLLKSRKLFFCILLILLLMGIFSVLIFGNSVLFNSTNAHHPFWLNVFFINYTFMGDGIFALCLAAIFIFYFKRRKEGTALLVAFIFTEILVQLIKNSLNYSNPGLYFEPGQTFLTTDDTYASGYQGFLSGHTAIAFALVTVFLSALKNKIWQLPLLSAAVLLAYSRMYLAQHSLPDILIATILGTSAGLLAVHVVYNRSYSFIAFRKIFKARYKDPLPSTTIQPV